MGAKYTEAQKRAAMVYQQKKVHMRVWTEEEKKEAYKKSAVAAGKSLNQYILDTLDQQKQDQGGAVQISATAIGNLISAHIEGDEDKFLAFANFIADTYEKTGEEQKARIIRKRIDGTYKDEPQDSQTAYDIEDA